jgi:hypothetical protein
MMVKGGTRRWSTGARAASRLVAVALAFGARRVRAHPEFSALGTNRYVTAAIFDGRVDVTDDLLEGTLVSGAERRRLDADGDGRISDAELHAGEEQLRAEGPAVTVAIDGRDQAPSVVVAIDLGDEPRATAAPLVVERRSSFPGAWSARARRLRITIAREPPRLLGTEVGVVLEPGLALADGVDRVTFPGPRASALEERAATFQIVAPPPPAPSKAHRVAFFGFGPLAVLLIVVLALRGRFTRKS